MPDSEHIAFKGQDGVELVGEHLRSNDDHRRAPSVLLAHGFGQTRQSWSATQARLADNGHDSFSWDTRGHGQSGRNANEHQYNVEDFVEDVVTASGLLTPNAVLIGASMGGLTGLMAQARHHIFSALVLVDVTPHWEAAGAKRIQSFMTAFPDGFDSYEHAANVIASYLPHRRERKTPAQLAHLLRTETDGRLRWHWDPRLLEEFVNHSEHLQDTIADAARGISIPVLLISGGRSDLVSERTIAHFRELVPHIRHVQLPEATHMVAGDDNNAFTDAVLDFLSAQFPPTPANAGAVPE